MHGRVSTDLFLTLVGVTLLFALAQGNGTLDQVVRTALRGCRGNAGLIPLVFFGLSLGIASIGAGNIAAAALVAPLAMAVARAGEDSPLSDDPDGGPRLCGRALSPIAPTGIIANGLMTRMGMSGFEWQNYLYNLIANTLAAGMGLSCLRRLAAVRPDPPRRGPAGRDRHRRRQLDHD